MSFPQSPDEQDEPTEATPTEDASEAVVETTECPNCGRRFVGEYCPDCGQKADQELSAFEIVGDFFRELMDTEHGLWQTFKGLTIRPGTTLRRYLQGKRRPLISPGRYLLVSAVLAGVVDQIERWLESGEWVPSMLRGALVGGARNLAEQMPPNAALTEAARHVAEIESLRILALVALAGLAALLFRILFRRNVDSPAESVAVAAYAVAHAIILLSAVRFADRLIEYAGTVDTAPGLNLAYFAILFLYPGIATYGCFGASWWNGMKGGLGMLWALVETALIEMAGIAAYAQWLLLVYPETYSVGGNPLALLLGSGTILFLSHGPAEIYFYCSGNASA